MAPRTAHPPDPHRGRRRLEVGGVGVPVGAGLGLGHVVVLGGVERDGPEDDLDPSRQRPPLVGQQRQGVGDVEDVAERMGLFGRPGGVHLGTEERRRPDPVLLAPSAAGPSALT